MKRLKTNTNELWDEITSLREEINVLKKQEYNNIKTISLECAEYRKKTEEEFLAIEANKEKIFEYLHEFEPKLKDISNINNDIEELNKSKEEIQDKINNFGLVIDEYKNIHSNIDIIKETYNEIKRTSDDLNDRKNQITSILHSVNTMKDNFDTLTYEVFGKKDDEENIQEGLKDKLQKEFSFYNDRCR